ncbi:MAG TPA: RodZ domain-containing protein [Thermoanaerobaculia bacterium]|nr:RodZ domain-containing protein [Thermoanaerobaculia bacterium]
MRREREIRAISLKEIADATKISKRFLDAIERNDHKTLPAPVFTRGFVREYARYLGLNAEEMVNRYNYAAAGDDRIEKSAHLDRLTPKPSDTPVVPPKRGIPSPLARVDRNIYLFILVTIALAAVIWWAVARKREARNEEARVVAPVVTVRPKHPPRPVENATATAQDAVLHLTIDMNDNSWIQLEADGVSVFNDEMKRGDHRVFDAKNQFRFKTIGNAAGPKLSLNGVQIPPLGREGKVLHDRVFDRKTLTEVPADSNRSEP